MSAQNHIARPHKIVVLSYGDIGEELWSNLARQNLADKVVVWNRSDKFHGKAFVANQLAHDQANIVAGSTTQFEFLHGKNTLDHALEGADIVVATGGVPRGGDITSRAQLLQKNCEYIDPIADAAARKAPDANYIIATNPVDAMTQRFHEKSGIPANRVIGLSGVLDRSRLIQSINIQLGVSPSAITGAEVIGEHGETMVPVISNIKVEKDGETRSLSEWLESQPEKIGEIINATVSGGARIIKFKQADPDTTERRKSDYIAPAAALEKMVTTLIDAKWHKKEAKLNCSSYLASEGVYIGHPVTFTKDGTFESAKLPELSPMERTNWNKSVKNCQNIVAELPDRPVGLKMA